MALFDRRISANLLAPDEELIAAIVDTPSRAGDNTSAYGSSSIDPRDRYYHNAGLDRAQKIDADAVALTSDRLLLLRVGGPRVLAEAPAEGCTQRWHRTNGRFFRFAYLHFALPNGEFYWATSQLRNFFIPSPRAGAQVEAMIEGFGARAERMDSVLLRPVREP